MRTHPLSLLVAFALLLLAPFESHLFNGLPLSSLPEFVALILLVPLLAGQAIRLTFARFLAQTRLAPATWGVIMLALGLKVALRFAPPTGFLACYRSTFAASGPCERSYENPWFRASVTRVDRALTFGPRDWNLSFINDNRWNWYEWERFNPSRERFPFTVTWRGGSRPRGLAWRTSGTSARAWSDLATRP
jgi:hypothetical protein